jgi:glycosyltransferase involved in cell wall biosynthesis
LKREVSAYDVVHIHSLYLHPQYAAYRAANLLNIPYLVSAHGTLDPWIRRRGRPQKKISDALWQRAMLEGATSLVFGATHEALAAADIAPNVDRVVVPLPVDWQSLGELPDPRLFLERHVGEAPGKLVLFMGRLTEKKRVDLLIEAFSRIALDESETKLVIAGPDEGSMRADLERLARQRGLEHRVAFVGMLQGLDKLAALSAADVWVLPSHSEGGSLAATEALAAGLAVVAPESVALAADAAVEGAALTCELTVEGLAETIRRVLFDDEARRQLGISARNYARRFAPDVVARDLATVYARVTGRGMASLDDSGRDVEGIRLPMLAGEQK